MTHPARFADFTPPLTFPALFPAYSDRGRLKPSGGTL